MSTARHAGFLRGVKGRRRSATRGQALESSASAAQLSRFRTVPVTASKMASVLGRNRVGCVSVDRIVIGTLPLFPQYGHAERSVTVGTAIIPGPLPGAPAAQVARKGELGPERTVPRTDDSFLSLWYRASRACQSLESPVR